MYFLNYHFYSCIIYRNSFLHIFKQRYLIIFKSYKDNNDYKYLNVYQEKFNGLYYKSTIASEQGFSKSYISFTNVSDRNDTFTVIYGYNKDLKVKSCEVRVSMYKNLYTLKLNLSEKEYFIDVFNGDYRGVINTYEENDKKDFEYFVD